MAWLNLKINLPSPFGRRASMALQKTKSASLLPIIGHGKPGRSSVTASSARNVTHMTPEDGKPPVPRKSDKPEEKVKKRKRKRAVGICTTSCRYESVRRAARTLGYVDTDDQADWTIFWTDCSVSLERCMAMKKYQRINHFPGMAEISRKDLLSRNLTR